MTGGKGYAISIVIATEGQETEKQYFEIFKNPITVNPRIWVKVIPSEGGRSSPEHILENLDKIKEEYTIGKRDELWLMVDVDRWGAKKLSTITKEAKKKGYGLAISNPCFECWLYLHFDDISEEKLFCSQIKKKLKEELGSYNSSNLNLDRFKGRENDAVRRAKSMDKAPDARWPLTVGSHVYRVVEKLIAENSE